MKNKFNFRHPIRVRYAEIDGQKIVFNGVYLTYMDVAFTEYLRNLGLQFKPGTQQQFDFVAVKTTLEFKSPAYFDEVLEVYCRVARMGNTSFTVEFAIYKENSSTLVLVADMVYVCVDPVKGTKTPLPGFFREKVALWEKDGEQ